MPANQNSAAPNPDRFTVYASRLKDSPYTAGEDEWPNYNEDKVSSLANEIVNGNNTCYLVSGYRGVGKTSFILQVQEKAERLLDEKRHNNTTEETGAKETIPECLFVLTNFAKYENHKSLLRRMIRDVYQVYKKNEPATIQNKEEEKFRIAIEDLYKRTFQDIKSQLATSNASELKITGETNISDTIKKYLPVLGAIISGGGSYYFINQWIIKSLPLTIFLAIGAVICFIFSLISVKASFTQTLSTAEKSTIEEIYDDEIADFKFQELLDSFHVLNYRLVFVLDELDKVSPADLDNLIKEMKPYLLSGKAHFVIVAGQELAYRYLWAYSGDDAVIGSLFSKFYHIPLFSRDNLEEIGKRLINLDNVSPDSVSKLSPLFDYLIFKCRRVPRSFIARFRQIVTWDIDENKEQTAYITIPDKLTTELQVQTLAIIKEIERLSITPKQYEPVLNDYLITQLFINAQQMIFKKDYLQSVNDYLEHYSKSDQLADKAYYQNVEEIIKDLFNRMKQENIIKEKIEEKKAETKEDTKPSEPVSAKKEEAPGAAEIPDILPPADDAPMTYEMTKFKNEWANFVAALNLFWDNEVRRNPALANKFNTTYDLLAYFNSIKAISFTPIQGKSSIALINNLDFVEGESRVGLFRQLLRDNSINPLAFQRQLTEFILRQQFKSKLNYKYAEQTLSGFDAAFTDKFSKEPDLLIDFRHSESADSDRSDIEKMIEKLSDYNKLSQKGNIVIIIETFFNPDSVINPGVLTQDFNSLIEMLNPFYNGKIIYYPISTQINQFTLDTIVDDCKAKLISYQEFSISDRIEEKRKMIPSITGFDPDDPQRFLWGQNPDSPSGRKLAATVSPIGKDGKTFTITLTVTGLPTYPLRGFVYFLVHPSFPEEIYKVLAKNNSATLQLAGYQAFTAGVVCDDGATELELNLNNIPGIPEAFRYKELPSIEQKSVKRPSERSISVKKRMKK
jgi:Cdc6-like AAA superfamily ATPase